MSDDYIEGKVRRAVGINALRRLRRLVDADAADELAKARRARRLAWAFGLATLLAVLLLAIR